MLDFTIAQQGPIATQVLGDYGADVVKVERPGRGDPMRGASPHGTLEPGAGGYGPGFLACNRNKKSIVLDLKTDAGSAIAVRLAERADVVVSNFRPGVMARLGLSYDALRPRNPRLIYAEASGYGPDGLYAGRIGQDMAAQCLGGLVARSVRYHARVPVPAGYNICDLLGGMLLAQGIMAALAARERTGEGQRVETNLLNAALTADIVGGTEFLNRPSPPQGDAPRVGNPTYALYQASDGTWVHLIDAFRDQPLLRMCRALDLPESLAGDSRFQHLNQLAPEAYEALHDLLAGAVRRLTAAEVVERFEREGLLAVPVNHFEAVYADPQVRSNDMVLEATHPRAGSVRLVGFPVKLSRTPARLRHAPPVLGEHGPEVLCDWLDMEEGEMDALKQQGVT